MLVNVGYHQRPSRPNPQLGRCLFSDAAHPSSAWLGSGQFLDLREVVQAMDVGQVCLLSRDVRENIAYPPGEWCCNHQKDGGFSGFEASKTFRLGFVSWWSYIKESDGNIVGMHGEYTLNHCEMGYHQSKILLNGKTWQNCPKIGDIRWRV